MVFFCNKVPAEGSILASEKVVMFTELLGEISYSRLLRSNCH